MDKRRVAASFVYTLDSDAPIRNGFVEYDAEGVKKVKFDFCRFREY